MKKDFDNLVLNYLSIYNESSRYMGPNDEQQPELLDIYDHEDRIAGIKKAAADDEAADNAPETCPTCESDIYDGECVNCGHSMENEDNESEYNHEDNESEYGDHYLDDVDYKDGDFNRSEDCPECGNEGCVDKNGHCHYCNLEDDEMESGKEYGEDELPPPPPITRPTVY